MPRSQSWKQAELFDAVKAGRINIVKQLIAAGADVNAEDSNYRLPLSYALDNYEITKLLIDAGANIDSELLLGPAYRNDFKMVKLLVEYGADVNAADNMLGRTALLEAYMNRNFKMIKYLLEHGADVNVRYYEDTLLRLAMDHYGNKDADLIRLLLDYGAKV